MKYQQFQEETKGLENDLLIINGSNKDEQKVAENSQAEEESKEPAAYPNPDQSV